MRTDEQQGTQMDGAVQLTVSSNRIIAFADDEIPGRVFALFQYAVAVVEAAQEPHHAFGGRQGEELTLPAGVALLLALEPDARIQLVQR